MAGIYVRTAEHRKAAAERGRLRAGRPVSQFARFWSKVRVGDSDQCWLWTAATNKAGYGNFLYRGKAMAAHRRAWELENGPIPDGAYILHSCDNPPCCNPAHLRAGTALENNQEREAKGRGVYGERHPQHKLTDEQVEAIRVDPRVDSVIASEYGISGPYVWLIQAGQTRKQKKSRPSL